MPTSPSQALLGHHRKPWVSEATLCQVCKPVSLQSLNFKLGRDCEVPEGREQERCLRGRGPGDWALGVRGCYPGPPQHRVSAGNELMLPHSALPCLGSPHLSSAQPPADTKVTGQQVGGKENPSSMLTILMKSFLNIEKPEYLLGEGNIMIL